MKVKAQKTMYLHVHSDGKRELQSTDMGGLCDGYFGVCLGAVECEIAYSDIDRDPVEALIESLEKQISEERELSRRKVAALTEKLDQLKCIEFRP